MKLVKSPDNILTQSAIEWDFAKDLGAAEVEQSMIQLMKESGGRGLAANQVGLLKRVFVIQLEGKEPIGMFNPRIISTSDTTVEGEEGCLSFPDLWLSVKRPATIESEYFDKNGNQCTIQLSGIDSRCFQHELDHLNGVCFTDKVSQLKLAMAKKKQIKMRKKHG